MKSAREKCPDLVRIPYEFDEYKSASYKFYSILGRYTTSIQAVSMDEAFLDLTGEVRADYLGGKDPLSARYRTRDHPGALSVCLHPRMQLHCSHCLFSSHTCPEQPACGCNGRHRC